MTIRSANCHAHDTKLVQELEKGAEVKLCGILTGIQRKRTKEGKLGRR